MTDNTQPEALLPSRETLMAQAQVFASAWAIAGSRFDPGDGMEVAEQEKAILADMTRRLHARIAELEAQLASIGAGGVSPLIGQPQAMPDLSQLTERGAKAWAGVDAQGLREGFTAADMATAAAQGFRDGAASLAASAGEPVAHLWQHCETGRTRIVMPDMIVDADASWQVVGPLYLGAAPPTAQAEGWRLIPVEPTGEMLTAAEMALYEARSTLGRYAAHKAAYRALLAAAPPPPTSAEGVGHAD